MKTKALHPRKVHDSEQDLPGYVAAEILRKVFRGEYQEGDRLTELSLTEELGVSRTPVREALLGLKGLGIVEIQRNRGAMVRRFDEEKLREIYEVRRLLEVEAARKACGRLDRELVDELRGAVEQLLNAKGHDPAWELDQRIHGVIAGSCGNERLRLEIDRYSILVQAIRNRVGKRMQVQTVTSEQHLEILTAIGKSNSRKAADAMRRHLEQAEETAVASVRW